MNPLARTALSLAVGIVATGVAVYSALPQRIAPVALVATGDVEVALKIVPDRGGDLTKVFSLPPAPAGEPRLGLAIRPATYLKSPSAVIVLEAGGSRCRFQPTEYTDGGTITCPMRTAGMTSMRLTIRGSTGPLALVERKTRDGEDLAGVWVQIPSRSLEGRLRFVLTALSTTRVGLFSWPLAIFGFAIAVCGSVWVALGARGRPETTEGLRSEAVQEPAASA